MSLAWKKRLSILSSAAFRPRSNLPGDRTSGGDLPLALPESLTKLFGRGARVAPNPSPPTLPLRSAVGIAVASVVRGRGRLGVLPLCVGVVLPLSSFDFLAEDRGVTLPVDIGSLAVSSCFTRGVTRGGSDRTVDGVLTPLARTTGGVFAAMRGVRGARATLGAARVGLSGRPVLLDRSDMVAMRYRGGGIEFVSRPAQDALRKGWMSALLFSVAVWPLQLLS
jgi:hypothetical protein